MKDLLETGAAIATIAAIIFAVISYRQAEQDNRIAAALGYVARFNSDPIITAFKTELQAYDTPAGQKLQSRDADPKRLTAQQIAYINSNNLAWDAVLLGDFFDQTYICVKQKICDSDLITTMLGRDIETTFINNGRYLQDFRARLHALTGCGLAALYKVAGIRLEYARLSPEDRAINAPPHPVLDPDACVSVGE